MLKRFFILLLLFSLLAQFVFSQDITITREDWETAKGQAQILNQSLKSKTIEFQSLQNLSGSQQREINQLLTDSENYQNQIKTLLQDSQTSEAEYQAIVEEVNGFIDGLNLTIKDLKFENKLLKIGGIVLSVVTFGLGVKVGLSIK